MSDATKGGIDWRQVLARAPSLARPAPVLIGATIAAIVGATLLAFVTIDPPPLRVRHAKGTTFSPSLEGAPAFADDDTLPAAAAPPPPTTADIKAAAPAVPTAMGSAATGSAPRAPSDLSTLPVEDVRARANRNELPAMEEMGRRLIDGLGIAKDSQAGAGWLLRAAELGSRSAAFNVGVMYERGFVVARDSTRAAYWYRRAADAGLPVAEHNLALMLRNGKGVPRNGAEAIELLHVAARQGMTASMFSLGDIYEQGDVTPKDRAAAVAWYAIAADVERQINHGVETPLAKAALQRAQSLRRILTPAEVQRAQEIGQREYAEIVAALAPRKPASQGPMRSLPEPALPPPAPEMPATETKAPETKSLVPADKADPAGWPASTVDQVRTIQQALFDLKLLNGKPDGALGPATQAAIRDFQHKAGLPETGAATLDVYAGLRQALARKTAASTPPAAAPKSGPN